MALPPLTAILGPAGSGKTQECLRRYREAGAGALLLVPSAPHVRRARERLAEDGAAPAEGSICTLRELAERMTGKGQARIIGRPLQRMIVGDVFEREIRPDDFFGRMRGAPGFAGSLTECIRDLKLTGLTPDELAGAVPAAAGQADDPGFERKLSEIARLFGAYQAFLDRHRLHDEEDLASLALRRADEPVPPYARLVIADGFFRFAPVWQRLLASLVERGAEAVVALVHDAGRPLLFASSSRTLDALRRDFDVTEEWREERMGSWGDDGIASPAQPSAPASHAAGTAALRVPADALRVPADALRVPADTLRVPADTLRVPADALHRLERGLFGGARSPDGRTEHGETPPIVLFDAPNPYAEAEMVAREMRREHDRRGIPWDRFAIIVRTVELYEAVLASVFHRFEVPVAFHREWPVAENPLVRTLAALIEVFVGGWRRSDVIGFLKSSYVPADKLAVDRLRIRAQRSALRSGRPGWERAAAALRADGDPLADLLERMLARDADMVGHERAAGQWLDTVRGLVEEFGLAPATAGDGQAIECAFRVVRDVAEAARLDRRGAMPLAEVWDAVAAGWRSATYTVPQAPGTVAVLEPYDARQVDAEIVAVMGLVERMFPRRAAEDPFLRDEERDVLEQVLGKRFERMRDRADDERLLFYLAATAPSERLILSWPRADERSDALRSFYVDEVLDVLGDVPARVRMLADVAPRADECATERDRLLAACAGLADGPVGGPRTTAPPPGSPPVPPGGDAPQPAGTGAESAAGSTADADAREVLLTRHRPRAPRLEAAEARQAYGATRRYGVTELETYNTCPFRHLMQHGLGLRADTPGAAAADRGTLLHRVLRQYVRRHRDDPVPPSAEEMREGLLAELDACLREAHIDAPPHRKRMLEQFLSDALSGFAEREARCREQFGFAPTWCELAFGTEDARADEDGEVEPGSRDYDPTSTPRPLVIAGAEGRPPVHLCGAIDRVDMEAEGRRALVLDYKAGKSVEFPHIKEGRSLQMVCYLMALEQLWGKTGAVGCYDSPRDTGRRRFFRVEHTDRTRMQPAPGEDGREVKPVSPAEYADTVAAVEQAVRQAAAGIAACIVTPTPGEHCRTCDFADVCRTTQDGSHDGEPLGD